MIVVNVPNLKGSLLFRAARLTQRVSRHNTLRQTERTTRSAAMDLRQHYHKNKSQLRLFSIHSTTLLCCSIDGLSPQTTPPHPSDRKLLPINQTLSIATVPFASLPPCFPASKRPVYVGLRFIKNASLLQPARHNRRQISRRSNNNACKPQILGGHSVECTLCS